MASSITGHRLFSNASLSPNFKLTVHKVAYRVEIAYRVEVDNIVTSGVKFVLQFICLAERRG